MAQVTLGQTLACRRCGQEFVCSHPRQRYCSREHAIADKEARPRKRQKRAEYNKKWRDKNFLSLRAYRQEYYRTNKAQLAEKQKAYKKALPPEIAKARRDAYYEAHKTRSKKRYHQTRAWLPWANALQGSKQRAKKHNIPFTLTPEWAISRWTGKCEVSGLEFVLSEKRNPYLFSPSIDRVVPSLGYTPENSRFVLHAVNALKGAGSDQDMLRIAQAIIQHNQ